MNKAHDDYFMTEAQNIAKHGTCDRARVGCILARDGWSIGFGFNSAPINSPTCNEVGHLMHDDHCVRTTHAEIEALANAAHQENSTIGATAYVTHAPCIGCAHALIAHGITRIVYADAYRLNDATRYVIEAAGVILEQWSDV